MEMSYGDLLQFLGDVLAEVTGVGGEEGARGDVAGCRVVKVKMGGIVMGESESLK